jgi:capsular exopolysaccharide synthesis family protein
MYNRVLEVKIDAHAPLMPHTTDSSIVEQYRRLRTKIQQQHEIKPIQSLLIASPGPGEGKSVTAMNLAMSFAMLPDYRVLLIDGDLRKGTVGKWLGVDNMPGLSNLVDGTARPQDVVFSCRELPMFFMTSGTSKRPAGELLTSSVLRDSIREMTRHFDLVLVDSPPVNLIADAQMLANSCDGVLLVARAFSTTTKAFQKTLDDIQSFRLVGTVLNGGMRTQRYKYHNY